MKRRRQENLVPIVSLVVVALLAVVVLPSALRPPPDSANASAALSPDAPPEENPDAIISSLQQAASSTAGATKSHRGPTATTAPPPPPPPPKRLPSGPGCFGGLQTESLYAAECKPAFVGDNGGSTYQNVEPDQVNIGFWHTTGMPSKRGPIPGGQPSSSDGAMRTWQVMQTYFNQRYETYNRKIQFVAIEDAAAGSGPAGERATAKQAVDQWHVLTSTHLNWPFCDELIRRELVCYNANPYPASFYERSQPFFFGYMMDFGKNIRLGAEYICKRLVGPDLAKPYTADYADGSWQEQPRKLGIITDTSNGNGISSNDVEASAKEQCGYSFDKRNKFDVKDPGEDSSRSGDFAAAITNMIANNVTTIYFTVNLTEILLLMQAAENANYYPEWVNMGNYGIDFNVIGAVLPKSQSSHLFGTSGWELARSNAQTECYRAYKSIDPNNDPDGFFCGVHFFEVQQIINAIQEAGPNLTPRSMVQGWYDYGYRIRPEVWASQGGYSPGDYSFIDKHGEIWFDQTQQDPTTGILGTFIWTHNGKRYGVGELPAGKNPDLFKRGLRTTTET